MPYRAPLQSSRHELPPRSVKRPSADKSLRDGRRRDLAYGCVDWFEYSDARDSLPTLEITRFGPQRVDGDADERPSEAAAEG